MDPKTYKLPLCWLGKQTSEDGKFRTITGDEINQDCTCILPMQAFMCTEGHLTECHKGMNCIDAECSHVAKYDLEDIDLRDIEESSDG